MDIFEEIERMRNKIKIAEEGLMELRSDMDKWYDQHRNEIKALYPMKNRIYEITDLPHSFYCEHNYYDSDHHENNYDWRRFKEETGYVDGDIFYFRPTNLRFEKNRTDYTGIPVVGGDILYSTLKAAPKLGSEYSSCSRIYITHLKSINSDQVIDFASYKRTKVYLMIDKNTGFYKIGRSNNPSFREKTLQSEKPTIEILHTYDAIVKDERELHQIFSNKRVRGEWFDLSGSDIEKIRLFFETSKNLVINTCDN